ncbi:retrovirus-related pol polyprotein from transposon TNT 1-94 [Tanacetum coccineum]
MKKLENLNEVRVKELRSDNGTEFRIHKLEEFCDKEGISQNFSSPYHLGKSDEKVDDRFFLRYSLVAKAFRVFNIRRQKMEETYHVTFNESDEVITQTSTEEDKINFNENRSFPITDDHHVYNEPNGFELVESQLNDIPEVQDITINDVNITIDVEPAPTLISPSTKINHDTPDPQDKWSRDKHILLVNILDEPQVGVTTRSRVKDSKAASTHECPYVNFSQRLNQNRVIETLKEERWVIATREWIDYDETFAPVAILQAIRIFLAYATHKGFVVYHVDVKSAFLNGKLSEKVYVQQPPGFESSEFPNYVCKLEKALFGLKQAPRAYLPKKYELADCASVKCPMSPPNKLGHDESGVFVNETQFRGMIGSLMYLIVSKPDIQFSICLCARSLEKYFKGLSNTLRKVSMLECKEAKLIGYKTGVKKCNFWDWYDDDVENEWYRTHLYEMYRLLNPSQRRQLETEISSQEEVVLLQLEMQIMRDELSKSQKKAFFWKSAVIIFVVVWFVSVMN